MFFAEQNPKHTSRIFLRNIRKFCQTVRLHISEEGKSAYSGLLYRVASNKRGSDGCGCNIIVFGIWHHTSPGALFVQAIPSSTIYSKKLDISEVRSEIPGNF